MFAGRAHSLRGLGPLGVERVAGVRRDGDIVGEACLAGISCGGAGVAPTLARVDNDWLAIDNCCAAREDGPVIVPDSRGRLNSMHTRDKII